MPKATRPKMKSGPPKVDKLPPWKVLLHNDDKNDFAKVLAQVVMLTSLNGEESKKRVEEAHKEGVSLLLVTHQERAELYVEQFASSTPPITVTIEKD